MNCKRSGRTRSWPNWGTILLFAWRNWGRPQKSFQNSRFLSWDSNRAVPPGYERTALRLEKKIVRFYNYKRGTQWQTVYTSYIIKEARIFISEIGNKLRLFMLASLLLLTGARVMNVCVRARACTKGPVSEWLPARATPSRGVVTSSSQIPPLREEEAPFQNT
jgi:hypothetical protein